MEYCYLTRCEYLEDYKIKCEFDDGVTGIFDFTEYLKRGGVFDKLNEKSYAKNISLINGVLTWGNAELDIAPETIYHMVAKKPLPQWTEI